MHTHGCLQQPSEERGLSLFHKGGNSLREVSIPTLMQGKAESESEPGAPSRGSALQDSARGLDW